MEEDVNLYDLFEFDHQCFSSVWLTKCKLKKHINRGREAVLDLNKIDKRPIILVIRNSKDAYLCNNPTFLVHGKHEGKILEKKSSVYEYMNTAFAVVCILQPTYRNSGFELSSKDCYLLDKFKEVFKKHTDNVYVVEISKHHRDCHIQDLIVLSSQINEQIYGKTATNTIFPRLFLLQDPRIPTRIGLIVHRSIINLVKLCHEKIQSNIIIHRKIVTLLKELMKISKKSPSKKGLSGAFPQVSKLSIEFIHDCMTDSDVFCDQHPRHWKTAPNKRPRDRTILNKTPGDKLPLAVQCQSSGPSSRYYKTRHHMKKESLCPKKCRSEKTKFLGKLFETGDAKRIKAFCENVLDDLNWYESIEQILFDEIESTVNNLALHEWKTVSERNEKVKGFGYGNNTIKIYLKDNTNLELSKKQILSYLKRYVDVKKFPVDVQYKSREIKLYSSVEQGSKILPERHTTHYGTLGMFLTDQNGEYFFTTCAHVIGKDDYAYACEDNTILGKNVFICHPNYNDKEKIDFSLVRIFPENDITCKLGLKTSSGKYTKGELFRGDITEIVNKKVYKWGATPPYLQQGKCIGYESEDEFLYLEINTENFAKKGDSGSIVCIGEDIDTCFAAFVIIGETTNEEEEKTSYVVYKISDAIDRLSESITPCFLPDSKIITITAQPILK